jgi:hypothetical protein
MGPKEEIRQARERARELAKGQPLRDVALALNVEFEGFYHVERGRLVRDHEVDYLPAIVIL